jgi:hypothetical protein
MARRWVDWSPWRPPKAPLVAEMSDVCCWTTSTVKVEAERRLEWTEPFIEEDEHMSREWKVR